MITLGDDCKATGECRGDVVEGLIIDRDTV